MLSIGNYYLATPRMIYDFGTEALFVASHFIVWPRHYVYVRRGFYQVKWPSKDVKLFLPQKRRKSTNNKKKRYWLKEVILNHSCLTTHYFVLRFTQYTKYPPKIDVKNIESLLRSPTEIVAKMKCSPINENDSKNGASACICNEQP